MPSTNQEPTPGENNPRLTSQERLEDACRGVRQALRNVRSALTRRPGAWRPAITCGELRAYLGPWSRGRSGPDGKLSKPLAQALDHMCATREIAIHKTGHTFGIYGHRLAE